MLSQELIFAALDAERRGKVFTIDFDDVWESYGYQNSLPKYAKRNARRYLIERSGLSPTGDTSKPYSCVGDPIGSPTNTCVSDPVGDTSKPYSCVGEPIGDTSRKTYLIDKNSKKIFLSVDSYKFSLAKAGTKAGEDYLWYLIDIEHDYRQRLKRSLNLTISDTPGYTHTLHSLWINSGIVNKYQVRDAITLYFTKDKDYHGEGLELQLTESCYTILMLSFRSKKGIDRTKLPSMLRINTEELYQYEQRKKANTRNPKARYTNPDQLELFPT